MKAEEQLANFLLFSTFVYPVASFLVSPHRKYSRTWGVIFAVLFLSVVAAVQLSYDESDRGNLFEILDLNRCCDDSAIKRAYRKLSLEYHPDKNKSADAVEKFQQIKFAYDVRGVFS